MRLNFSNVEVRDLDPVPSGYYNVYVTDGELKEAGPNAKHAGAKYVNWQFTINGGPYDGRKVWTNTMLEPESLLFSIKSLLAAVGFNVDGEVDFSIDAVVGKQLDLRVVKKNARVVGDKEFGESNDVKGFYKSGEKTGAATSTPGASASNSLLP